MTRKKTTTKSRGGASKRQEISVYARKGLPKAAQQAAKAAKGLGPVKAGTSRLPKGTGVASGAKYAPGKRGPSRAGRMSDTPDFGRKDDKAAKAKFEAAKKKLSKTTSRKSIYGPRSRSRPGGIMPTRFYGQSR